MMVERTRKTAGPGKEATPKTNELLRALPSVSSLLEHGDVRQWLSGLPRVSVVGALQIAVESFRGEILKSQRDGPVDVEEILAFAEQELTRRSMPSLRRVINATGIVLHTGLGRAPLSHEALEAVHECASGYCNLEYDLLTGQRGKRQAHIVELLTGITGAESATVVNNNAAATVLILRTFASGREVIVSRGQLIEIGGSFRLPEIMHASGAILREVGTTNRTRLSDYEKAINEQSALLLRVHPSNYRVVGFAEEVPIEPLAALAHRFQLLAVDDLGSGALFDLTEWGLPREPNAKESVEAGADLICFSGDKLLGGPQCGIILGKKYLVESLDSSPLMRAFRVDKLTLAALEATLRAYLDPREAPRSVPGLRMLTASTEELADRARVLCEQLQAALPGEHFYVCSDIGYAGGGSMPGEEVPTVVVQWRPNGLSAAAAAAALHEAEVPVITRIRDDALCFDLRTVAELDFDDLVSSTTAVLMESDEPDEERSEGVSLPIL